MEIDIGLSDLEPVNIRLDDNDRRVPPSVNFGPGIELLMNDKKKSSSANTSVDLGELDKLEEELNGLSGGLGNGGGGGGGESGSTKSLSFANWFGGSSSSPAESKVRFDDNNDSNLGEATANSVSGISRTNDGFSKLNMEVPMDYSAASAKMTDREKRRKKRLMIKKLEEWYEKGSIKHSSHFNMESNYDEVEDEYEGALEDKRKKDSVKMYGWWFMTLVNSVEYANSAFNPFDLNLDGWGEQVNEELESYEELFAELHQKYKGGKLAPEISLLLRLGFSAAIVNFTNKALSTATPAFNDVIRQNPDLMKMFTNATVQSMSQASPGFNMASQMMNQDPSPSTSFGPPPAPMATKNQAPPARPQMQYTQRADIAAGRGTTPMFRESGVDLQDRTPAMQSQPQQSQQQQSQQQQSQQQQQQSQQQQKRPEMRGPQNMDLNQILSGLKTRDVVLGEEPPRQMQPDSVSQFFGQGASSLQQLTPENASRSREFGQGMQGQQGMQAPQMNMTQDYDADSVNILNENDSMISLTSLRDMQNATMPKRSRRKQRSDRNTISLDI